MKKIGARGSQSLMISCGLTPRNILLALMCCHAEFGGSGEMSPPVESLIENFAPLDTYPIGVRVAKFNYFYILQLYVQWCLNRNGLCFKNLGSGHALHGGRSTPKMLSDHDGSLYELNTTDHDVV